MTLGNKIQELRKNKYLSQEAFAEIMGVTRQSVSKWELDQSYPAIEKLVEIADFFGISLDELLREQGKSINTSESEIQTINSTSFNREDNTVSTVGNTDKITISKEIVWYFIGWAVMMIIVILLFGLQYYFAGFLVIQVFIWTTVIWKIYRYIKSKSSKAEHLS